MEGTINNVANVQVDNTKKDRLPTSSILRQALLILVSQEGANIFFSYRGKRDCWERRQRKHDPYLPIVYTSRLDSATTMPPKPRALLPKYKVRMYGSHCIKEFTIDSRA